MRAINAQGLSKRLAYKANTKIVNISALREYSKVEIRKAIQKALKSNKIRFQLVKQEKAIKAVLN